MKKRLQSRNGSATVFSIVCKPCGLVLFLFVGEVAGFYVVDIFGNGIVDDGSQVGIAAEETRRESLVDAEHVVHHQYLPVTTSSGTDSNNRNSEHFSHLRSEFSRSVASSISLLASASSRARTV